MFDKFSSLVDEFSDTAKSTRANPRTLPFLAAQYLVLVTHGAETPDQKQQFATMMLENSVNWLQHLANPQNTGTLDGAMEILAPMFSALAAPESLEALPANASELMAGAALALSRKGLKMNPNKQPIGEERHDNSFNELISLTNLALDLSGKFRKAVNDRTFKVETAQPISASKPFVLKTPAVAA
jgi:hypothetical protein